MVAVGAGAPRSVQSANVCVLECSFVTPRWALVSSRAYSGRHLGDAVKRVSTKPPLGGVRVALCIEYGCRNSLL